MHHHHLAPLIYIIYGFIVLFGGVYGYVKAGSVPSMTAGVISGIIAIFAGVMFRRHPMLAALIAAILGLVLTAVFYRRYITTQKAMPAIPVGILSALVCLYSIFVMLAVHHMRQHGG
jgi:uncharacterized membrane protein (UPF0136 family)